MAKSSLPSVDGPVVALQKMNEAHQKIQHVEDVATVPAEGYVSRRVDAKLNRSQAIILRDKLRALQDAGARMANGTFVTNRTQAIQWILENEVVR